MIIYPTYNGKAALFLSTNNHCFCMYLIQGIDVKIDWINSCNCIDDTRAYVILTSIFHIGPLVLFY